MISLSLEHQKRNEQNAWLKKCEPEVIACDYQKLSQKKKKS